MSRSTMARKLAALRSFVRYLCREIYSPTIPLRLFLPQAGQTTSQISLSPGNSNTYGCTRYQKTSGPKR